MYLIQIILPDLLLCNKNGRSTALESRQPIFRCCCLKTYYMTSLKTWLKKESVLQELSLLYELLSYTLITMHYEKQLHSAFLFMITNNLTTLYSAGKTCTQIAYFLLSLTFISILTLQKSLKFSANFWNFFFHINFFPPEKPAFNIRQL